MPDVTEVNRPDGIFDVVGSDPVVTSLASDVSLYADTVTVTSATGISIGDAVMFLSSSERWYEEGDTTCAKTTINRVMNIAGNVLTLQHAMNHSFDLSVSAVTVTAWTGVQNFHLKGGNYIGPGYEGAHENGVGPAVLYSLYTQRLKVEGIQSTTGFQGAWLWTQKNYGGEIINNFGAGLPDDYTDALVGSDNMGFTGIIVTESMGVNVKGNHGYRFRHLVDGSRSRSITVDGNFAFDCHRAPFGSHLGTTDWTFIGNHARSRFGGGGGILWRGHDVKVIGNDFGGTIPSGSYGFYDTVGHQDDIPKTYIVSGNKFASARSAVGLYANIGRADITDNHILGGVESTSYPPVDVASMDMQSLRISGGSIKCHTGGSCIDIENNTPRTRDLIQVEGVKLEGFTSYAVSSPNDSATDTTLLVERCHMVPSGTPTGYVNAGDTYDVLSLKPNYADGAELNLADHYGGSQSTLVLSDGTTNVNPQTTRTITWNYKGGVLTGIFSIRMTSKGALSGALRITGWPKSPTGVGGGQVSFAAGLSVASGETITLVPVSGSDRVDLYLNDATTGPTTLQASEITDTFRIEGSISFLA